MVHVSAEDVDGCGTCYVMVQQLVDLKGPDDPEVRYHQITAFLQVCLYSAVYDMFLYSDIDGCGTHPCYGTVVCSDVAYTDLTGPDDPGYRCAPCPAGTAATSASTQDGAQYCEGMKSEF